MGCITELGKYSNRRGCSQLRRTGFLGALLLSLICSTGVQAATVSELMCSATQPIGKCLYVYGGGWNEEDTEAGIEALSYGISPMWIEFYNNNSSLYNYKTTRYQIHNGLDCTGYVGWCMYQLFGDKYSENGYVFPSEKMADGYNRLFGAEITPRGKVKKFTCGDIMTKAGHVYIVLGSCPDGSVVFMHASPPCVSLCGTYTPDGRKSSMAVALATEYMKKYFPECYTKYPNCSRNTSYLTDYSSVSLPQSILPDPDGYRNMDAAAILNDMFEEVKLLVDGKRVMTDDIYIIEGSTYVPLRAVSEALGARVQWEPETQNVIISRNKTRITVRAGSSDVRVNEKEDKLPGDVFISHDRTYIPVRFIAENLGGEVSWEGKWKKVLIVGN